MSMLDKLKNMMKGHEDTGRKGVEKAGDTSDQKTGNKYSGQVDSAQQKMNEQMGMGDRPPDDRPPQP